MPRRSPVGGRPGWWARRSLRLRLTAAASVVVAVAITVSAVLLTVRLRGDLTASLDETARQQAGVVASALETGRLGEVVPVDDDDVLVQVLDASGVVVAGSPGLSARPMAPVLPSSDLTARVRTVETVVAPDGDEPHRLLALPVRTGPEDYVVLVAVPLDEAEESIEDLRRALALGVPVVVALLVAVTWVLVGRALRPVDVLRRQAAELSGTAPDQRLQVPPGRDELARLATTFNDLLDRVEEATGRQREFVADAAHEIRSPLAALRAQLEVAQLQATGPDAARAAWRADLTDMVQDAARLSRLVDDLLRLARLDSGAGPVLDPVDLDDLVLESVRRARATGRVPVDAAGVQAARVAGEEDALSRVVDNLLDNATRHARSAVTVRLSTSGREAVLEVHDDGPGIPVEARERVFDRFVRLDEARSRDVGGSGLGLAIVRDVVRQHGGRVAVEGAGSGTSVVARLPLVDG